MAEFNQDLQGVPIPHQVALVDGTLLNILSVKRYLPMRRVVCQAQMGHQVVYAKLFIGKGAKRYAARDKNGVALLSQAHIKTPLLIKKVAMVAPLGVALIFEAIEPALNAQECWQEATASQRKALMRQLVLAVAQHHQAHLLQSDLYFKNFLIQNNSVFTLDGDGVCSTSRWFEKRQQWFNLATLFSKMDVLETPWIPCLYEAYCKAMHRQFLVKDADCLTKLAQTIRLKSAHDYAAKKVFRNCTDVNVSRSATFFQLIANASSLDVMSAHDLDQYLASPEKNIKNGNTCAIAKAQFKNQSVVIKRYNIKNPLHALSRCWRPSRAAASWANAHRLRYYGIATPAPLLMLETRWFGLRGVAYFVAEYSPWLDAKAFFQTTADKRLRAEAVRQLCSLCYQFYLLQLSHGDMKASNLHITDQGQVVVLDLDSMRQHRCAKTALRAHVKDLRRLMQNWQDDTSLYNALVKGFYVVYADATPLRLAGISI